MYGSLDISTSGMIAQRARLTVIASNINNKDTILDADGNVNPYRRRSVLFAPGDPAASSRSGRAMGVHVAAIEAEEDALRYEYDPDSPHALKDGPWKGHIPKPNISTVIENVNALEAARAYEANVAAAEATKSMMAQALRMIA